MDLTEYIGNQYGYWTVIDIGEQRKYKSCSRNMLVCQCVCKNIRTVDKSALINGKSTNCGCGGIVLNPGEQYNIPWYKYERKKGRAFGRGDAIFCHVHEWKNDIKPWKIVITNEETIISMKRLMNFNTELVIQYLKERGITTCPMNF